MSDKYIGSSPFSIKEGFYLGDRCGAKEGLSFSKFQALINDNILSEAQRDIVIFLSEMGELTQVLITKAFLHPDIPIDVRRAVKYHNGKMKSPYRGDINFLVKRGILSYRDILKEGDKNEQVYSRIYSLTSGAKEWAFRTKSIRESFYKQPCEEKIAVIDSYEGILNHEAAMMFHISAVIGCFNYFKSFKPDFVCGDIKYDAMYELKDKRKIFLMAYRRAAGNEKKLLDVLNKFNKIDGNNNLIFLSEDFYECRLLHELLSSESLYDVSKVFYVTDLTLKDMPDEFSSGDGIRAYSFRTKFNLSDMDMVKLV